jgi:tetratricopeptide (TPR) repeat protein
MAHPEALNADTCRELRALVDRYPYFQMARLLYLRNLMAVQDASLTDELHRSAAYLVDRQQLFRLMEDQKQRLRPAPDADAAAEVPSADRTLELIEAFLSKEKSQAEERREESQAASPEIPETDAEEGYFTETLARIYIKQQRYSKALEIIKKINLKNPKKNIYFADQIRFLEKLIINNKSK